MSSNIGTRTVSDNRALERDFALEYGNWCVEQFRDGLGEEVLGGAKRCVLDVTGCAIAGSQMDAYVRFRGFALSAYGRQSPVELAYLASSSAHLLDFDDTSYSGILHGSAAVWPAVLAAGLDTGLNGYELLSAFTVGVELTYLLGEGLGTDMYDQSAWWNSAVLGVVGAAAGSATAMGLRAGEVAEAIRMAAATAGCTRSVFGVEGKPHTLGTTSAEGVQHAMAARSGIKGGVGAIEGAQGYIEAFNAGRCATDLTPSPTGAYRILNPGIFFKKYPICSAAHAAADAVGALMAEHDIASEDIGRVRCNVPRLVLRSLIINYPATPAEAQISMPFALACKAVDGEIGLQHLRNLDEVLSRVSDMMARITMGISEGPEAGHDEHAGPEWATVEIELQDGTMYDRFVGYPAGTPNNPLSDAQLVAKFVEIVSPVYGNGRAQTIASSIMSLERHGGSIPREIWDLP